MVRCEIRMLEELDDGPSLLGVEGQGLFQKVNGCWSGRWKEVVESLLLAQRHLSDVVSRSLGADGIKVVGGRGTQDVHDEAHLVVIVPAWKQRSTADPEEWWEEKVAWVSVAFRLQSGRLRLTSLPRYSLLPRRRWPWSTA